MAGGIVYLDIDDEITSAAARIRNVAGRRVALVLPHGSRVATSRINFRLLSRDAMVSEKRLSVVAGDPATRALAASAGLPVFASVGEYETSLLGATDATGGAVEADGPRSPTPPPIATPTTAEPVAAVPAPASAGEPTAAIPVSPAQPADIDRAWLASRAPSAPSALSGPPANLPSTRPATGRSSRAPLILALAVLALIVLVGGVAAYVVLPAATIVVTPRVEDLVPLDLTITADPTATEPDATARVVPAELVSLDVSATDTFPATGKRVEETEASGTVRFSNLDFLRRNTVPAGSIVSTNAGVRFQTIATVTVPRADLVGLTVFPGRISVGVTAFEPGLEGNVEPNTIVIVPKGEDPQALKVVNPDALAGGTHEEFLQVSQEDLDAALEALTGTLSDAFQARLADPAIAAPGATVFATSASLGPPTPTVDPASLLGQEVDSFELGLSASGSVVTADPAPVAAIAEELVRTKVEPGYQLVTGSIKVTVGDPSVSGQSVSFPVTATARQVAIVDPAALRSLVLGRSLAEAREILAPYGAVELTAWPAWVGTVPTLADRVDLRVEAQVPVETPVPSGSAP